MDPIVVVAIILGIIVVLFVLDWRLNRTRTRPWRKAPPSETQADREHRPHQSGRSWAAAPVEAALPAKSRLDQAVHWRGTQVQVQQHAEI
jgi:hypothetical protein